MSHASTAVREALDAVASGDVRERILRRALELAGEDAIPEDPGRLDHFVRAHLADALEQVLGEGSSDAVIEGLAPIVARAATTAPPPPPPLALPTPLPPHHPARRRLSSVEIPAVAPPPDPSPEPTPRPAPAPRPARPSRIPTLQGMPQGLGGPTADDDPPPILFATSDPTEVADLEEALSSRSGVAPEILLVADSGELQEAVRSLGARTASLVLVVSGRAPSVTPITIAAMAPDLPAGFHVVVWGRSPEADAASQAPQGARLSWTRFDSMTPAADVASTCVELLRTSAA